MKSQPSKLDHIIISQKNSFNIHMIIMETNVFQKLFWCKFSKFIKRIHLKGNGHRMEERIPGLTIGIRYCIYGNNNNHNRHRRNCICVTLFTRDANAVEILEGLFETINELFQGNGITITKEHENNNDHSGLRIIVTNTQINVYELKISEWGVAFKWMDETIKKLIEILLKKVTIWGNKSLSFLKNY